MAVRKRIEWTPEAFEQLERVHHFVQRHWNERIADRVLSLVQEFGSLALRYPHAYPSSPVHPDLRMGEVHRNVKLICRVDPDRILIVTVLDTRADNSAWF